MRVRLGLLLVLGLLSAAAVARAADKPASVPESGQRSVTQHTIDIHGTPLHYTATADFMPLRDDTGQITARLFYVAYTRTDAPVTTAPATTPAGTAVSASEPESAAAGTMPSTNPAKASDRRPIMFIFNGGPGAASAWLQLGCAGPWRLQPPAGAEVPKPPYQLVPNEDTWLSEADLVFIDPVGTGYSRATDPQKARNFYNTREDIASVGEFIRLYLTQYDRWGSPKFLAGESYGTTRAAALSNYLLDEKGIALNGVILISTVLNFQTLMPSAGNDLPYALFLPSYTAAAWYHHRLPADLQGDLSKALAESEHFAATTYLEALAQGSGLDDDGQTKIATELSRLTGEAPAVLRAGNLRIDPSRFMQGLLRDQGLLIGRMDTRLTAHEADPLASRPDFDPAIAGYMPAYTETFLRYVRNSLKFDTTLQYELLRGLQWDFGTKGFGGGGYLYVADDLRDAMIKNPHLQVLVASGYFDLATPYFATDYTLRHMGLPAALRGHITQSHYLGGHMMYHNAASLKKLGADVAAFVVKAQQ